MNEKTYLLKEIELVNDLFKSIKGSVNCEFGGFEQLGFTEIEVKQLIKTYIDQLSK